MSIEPHRHQSTDSPRIRFRDIQEINDIPSGNLAQGDIFYIDTNGNPQRLAAGTSGQYLQTQGTNSNPQWATVNLKYGGTGADGALSISSGTTTISCGSAAFLVKNYTSISITGTAQLAFSNVGTNGTFIILKSQGDVTITSSTVPAIDVRSFGGPGGSGQSAASANQGGGGGGGAGASFDGTNGSAGNNNTGSSPGTGKDGVGPIPSFGGGVASPGTAFGPAGVSPHFRGYIAPLNKMLPIAAGGGGGAGCLGPSGTQGVGGNGGGALYIECGGTLNITSTLDASGAAGTASTGTSGSGGGGGGGSIGILYRTLTANSGTYTITGGAGAIGVRAGGNGGDGLSFVAQNTEFA